MSPPAKPNSKRCLLLRERRSGAKPQHRLFLGFLDVRREEVFVIFEIDGGVLRTFDTSHFDLRIDEQKSAFVEQFELLFELLNCRNRKTVIDPTSLCDLH